MSIVVCTVNTQYCTSPPSNLVTGAVVTSYKQAYNTTSMFNCSNDYVAGLNGEPTYLCSEGTAESGTWTYINGSCISTCVDAELMSNNKLIITLMLLVQEVFYYSRLMHDLTNQIEFEFIMQKLFLTARRLLTTCQTCTFMGTVLSINKWAPPPSCPVCLVSLQPSQAFQLMPVNPLTSLMESGAWSLEIAYVSLTAYVHLTLIIFSVCFWSLGDYLFVFTWRSDNNTSFFSRYPLNANRTFSDSE